MNEIGDTTKPLVLSSSTEIKKRTGHQLSTLLPIIETLSDPDSSYEPGIYVSLQENKIWLVFGNRVFELNKLDIKY